MVDYNPLSDAALNDPHPIYSQLRDGAPAYFVEEFGCWFLSRFDDIWEQTGDTRTYSASARGTTPAHLLTNQLPVFPSVNLMDPPEHVRNRALISGAFKPRRVASLRPLVEEIVQRHIDDVAERGEGDPWPTTSGRSRWRSRAGCWVCLEALIEERRKKPLDEDVLMNAYLGARFDGKPLPDDNVASQMATLVIGSTDSFPKIFAAGLLALHDDPQQRSSIGISSWVFARSDKYA